MNSLVPTSVIPLQFVRSLKGDNHEKVIDYIHPQLVLINVYIEGICIVCEKWMFVITPQPYLDLCAVMHVANSDRCRQAHTCKSLFHKDKHNNSLPLPTQTHAQGARLQAHHTYRKCDTLFIIRSQHIYCRLVLILLKLF